MNYSPIALFVYKRPEHTRRTLESLIQCPEFVDSPLYVFCDGAKKEEDKEKVMQAREVVYSLVGTKAEIIESTTNRGLANSIISGVTSLCDKYQRVIVVEDDLVVAPQFLGFLNVALEKYKNESSLMHVTGYMYPIADFKDGTDALFLPFISSWGWGTWKRAWNYFDPQATGWELLKKDKNMRHRFNLDSNYNFFEMLKMQMSGDIDSWAIRWYWSIFQNNGYTVFPPISYVKNIGFDSTATHGNWTSRKYLNQLDYPHNITNIDFPNNIKTSSEEYKIIQKFLLKLNPRWLSFTKKILSPVIKKQ
ncbi:MAG: glycosyltransferase family 2 protein [Nostoc sp. NOS(2021)]|uniref:hypothetical protein n=1 Tax=Nostoc sp. NOS(2021) TaxID=2815407 RepID=UPI0025CE3437|nr:hypothetical protein [Nostoc sp. NOS(2021)]MBN3894908.1 glycosyltransferase family 2 protein [Nostoc sp. NOS(2021)]